MTLTTAGNVGVGTTSPNSLLEINGEVRITRPSVNTQYLKVYANVSGTFIEGVSASGNAKPLSVQTDTNSTLLNLTTVAAQPIVFNTTNTERVRIDANGNFCVGTSTALISSAGRGNITLNGSNDVIFSFGIGGTNSGYIYSASGLLEINAVGARSLNFVNNGADRMRITSAGNCGIGTTSPAVRLQVTAAGSDSTYNEIARIEATALNSGSKLTFYGKQGSDASTKLSGAIGFNQTANADSNGQPAFIVETGNNGSISERMRITSAGYLKASNDGNYVNSTGTFHEMYSTAAGTEVLIVRANSGSYTGDALFVDVNRNTTNNSFFPINYYNRVTSTYRFRVADSGNVTNTNNSYGSISDIKLKENIVDATPKLEKLNQVRIVNYNLIGEEQKQIGVIAQELQQIFPSMVDDSPDKDKDGNDLGTTTKQVKYSVFVPMLIKAMQEQQALIENLTTRLNALEGK
jgi:hypothetical protein